MQLEFMRSVKRADHRKVHNASCSSVHTRTRPQSSPAVGRGPLRHCLRELVRPGERLVHVLTSENFSPDLKTLLKETAVRHGYSSQLVSTPGSSRRTRSANSACSN